MIGKHRVALQAEADPYVPRRALKSFERDCTDANPHERLHFFFRLYDLRDEQVQKCEIEKGTDFPKRGKKIAATVQAEHQRNHDPRKEESEGGPERNMLNIRF